MGEVLLSVLENINDWMTGLNLYWMAFGSIFWILILVVAILPIYPSKFLPKEQMEEYIKKTNNLAINAIKLIAFLTFYGIVVWQIEPNIEKLIWIPILIIADSITVVLIWQYFNIIKIIQNLSFGSENHKIKFKAKFTGLIILTIAAQFFIYYVSMSMADFSVSW